MASGTSRAMASMQASATGVRIVTSSTRTPPATRARASGTASCHALQDDDGNDGAVRGQIERVHRSGLGGARSPRLPRRS
jgi:hypothetical protein